jgi:hypothetical protein
MQQPDRPAGAVLTDSSFAILPADAGQAILPEGDIGLAISDPTSAPAVGDIVPVTNLSQAAPAVGPLIAPGFPTLELALPGADTVPNGRPMAREYSDGYYTRLSIHKYASYATLPLFVAEYYLGQKLFTADSGTSNDGLRTAHSAVAFGIAGLFAVNTVTGVWNMWEARKDPEGRTRRYVHGFLMILADAGFVATAASAPGHEEERNGTPNPDFESEKTQHRNLAIASFSTALAGYLMMLVWK